MVKKHVLWHKLVIVYVHSTIPLNIDTINNRRLTFAKGINILKLFLILIFRK